MALSSSSSSRLHPEIASVSVKSELTSSPDSRLLRLPTPTVPLTSSPIPSLATKGAISSPQNKNNTTNACQDVFLPVNTSASSTSVTLQFGQPSNLETAVSSSSQSSSHVLTNPNKRLRTTNQVFQSSSDLAAHYGIPQILPPPPTTTTVQRSAQAHPAVPQPQAFPDFNALRDSYLNMLSSKPNNEASADTRMAAPAAVPHSAPQPSAVENQRLEELINYLASPEFKDHSAFTPEFDMNQFLTSPLPELLQEFDSPEETPYQDFLNTPVVTNNDHEFMSGQLEFDPNMPLFDWDAPILKDEHSSNAVQPAFDMDNLLTISPETPMLDTPSMEPLHSFDTPLRYPSATPSVAPSTPRSAPPRRRVSATGTRKGITPETLVPLDAPTQPRKYVIPSATSRKELPAVFARKRARSQAFGEDEEDELDNEHAPGPNATEKEQIEWKRRQNTLAARKSRKRKLQHQQELEDTVKQLTQEREVWKTRALTFRQLLVSRGIPFNEFED